jgi:hypothetical protein
VFLSSPVPPAALVRQAFAVRPSTRALGGFVSAVGFASFSLAAQFARFWAVRLPAGCGGCIIKRAGGMAWVSVPVLPASAPALCRQGSPVAVVGSPPACRSAVVAGGVWSW